MQTLPNLMISLFPCFLALFRSRSQQAIVELTLRQQLATYAQARPKPGLALTDRPFWVALRRLWLPWKEPLVIVKPNTVVRWHGRSFRLYWRPISKRQGLRRNRGGSVARLLAPLSRMGFSRSTGRRVSGYNRVAGHPGVEALQLRRLHYGMS